MTLTTDTAAAPRRGSRFLAIAATLALALGASVTGAGAAQAEDIPTTGTITGTVAYASWYDTSTYETRLAVTYLRQGADSFEHAYFPTLDGFTLSGLAAGSYSIYADVQQNFDGYWYGNMGFGTAPGERYDVTSEPVTIVTAGETTDLAFDTRYTLSTRPEPTFRGELAVGATLTALTRKWDSGVLFSYQWTADGNPIAGATASTLTLGAAQYKKLIGLEVTGYKTDFIPFTTSTEANTRVIVGSLTATPTPTISGTVKVGKKLTVKAGTWKPATVTLKYQWKANGKAISGATKSTYTITKAVKGKKITVSVTGSKTAFTSVAKTSKSTAAVK